MTTATTKPTMREAMPQTAAFIDALRREFGAAMIDAQIRAALKGEPVFYAQEGGHQVGTPLQFAVEVPALPSPAHGVDG